MAAGITLFVLFAALIILEAPVAAALGISGVVAMVAFHAAPFSQIASSVFSQIDSFALVAIPLFIIAGSIFGKSGISRRLVNLASLLVGNVRGGLAIVLVIVSMFFAAISGSGPASVAAVGIILIPAMIAAGYDSGFTSALMAAGGSIGIIIPPSIALIIYGVISGASIERLFLGGVFPGLLVGLALIAVIRRQPDTEQMKKARRRGSLREIWTAFREAFFGLLAPLIILGGIYSGKFTATESAAVAVVYAMVVDVLIYREMDLRDVFKTLAEAGSTSAQVLIIVACASIFKYVLEEQEIASAVADALIGLSANKYVMLLLINVMLIAFGCVLDAISIFYILLPILLPVIDQLGIDRVHFGIIITVNLAIGQVTPPVGVNLFVASSISGVPLAKVSRAAVRIVAAELAALLLITYIPQLSLWLPSLIRT
ncbi:MAG: TRAP transporter large permease [Planctomycetes bacterium]|nr:TRAP transporter large permease [Planctomycetota bacterium]